MNDYLIVGYLPVSVNHDQPLTREVVDEFCQMIKRSLGPQRAALEVAGLMSIESATALGWCLVASGQWPGFQLKAYKAEISVRISEAAGPNL